MCFLELGLSVRRLLPEVFTVRSQYLALNLFNFITSAVFVQRSTPSPTNIKIECFRYGIEPFLHSVFVNGHFKCTFVKAGSSDGRTKHTQATALVRSLLNLYTNS